MVAVQSSIENPLLRVLYLLPIVLSASVLSKCLSQVDSSGLSLLLISLYMPAEYQSSSLWT